MIETLLGGLLGGAFRLAPEVLKWLDRTGERSHELAMQDKALEFEKLRGASRMAEIGASADAAWNILLKAPALYLSETLLALAQLFSHGLTDNKTISIL